MAEKIQCPRGFCHSCFTAGVVSLPEREVDGTPMCKRCLRGVVPQKKQRAANAERAAELGRRLTEVKKQLHRREELALELAPYLENAQTRNCPICGQPRKRQRRFCESCSTVSNTISNLKARLLRFSRHRDWRQASAAMCDIRRFKIHPDDLLRY